MKLHSLAIAALCTAVVVEASSLHHSRTVNSRHARLARRDGTKRCRNRTPPPPPQNLAGDQNQNRNQTQTQNQNQDQNQNKDQTQNQDQNQNKDQNQNQGQNQNQNQDQNQSQNQDQNKDQNKDNSNNQGGVIGGLLKVASNCGDIGATLDVSSTRGPNGFIDWLNCGVEDSGWRPQNVQIGDLKVADLRTALTGDSPFKACNAYVEKFYTYGAQYDIPAIVVASFAMQESTCNPSTIGGGGEAGMFQLSQDKCGEAPNGDCYDVDYNIRTGVKYFKDTLDKNGGNVIMSIGQYNGWQPGMTVGSATAAANGPCCRCQNNLDYIFQMVNGWFQNKDPYSGKLGKYFNLDKCPP